MGDRFEAAPNQLFSRRPQVISFFCGAGGLDLGFSQAGFDIAFAADFDAAAVATHNANSSAQTATQIDLSKITIPEIKRKLEAGDVVPVGIIGGPPCQGFSRANTQRCHSDPRNNLAKRYASMIVKLADLYPIEFFVFENVPELLAKKNSGILAGLKRTLSKRFHLYISCLNASDFGVPQNRERVFLVGLRKTPGCRSTFEFPTPTVKEKRTVREAIAALPEPAFFERGLRPEDVPHHPNHWTMRPRSARFGSDLVSGGRSLIRLDWDKPSRTVAYGHREIHVHPTGLRRLSIYEAMMLQGFPKTYRLCGNLSEQVTQVSNAVPPPVAHAIAERLAQVLQLRN
ncbi:DNA cytosine methyltransferase [Ralstonia pickettii]|nr:DNA cytosine methyltransferase [Ralstonia pickettii]